MYVLTDLYYVRNKLVYSERCNIIFVYAIPAAHVWEMNV